MEDELKDVEKWTDQEKVDALCGLKITISKSQARRMLIQQPEKSVKRIQEGIRKAVKEDVKHRVETLLNDEEAMKKLTKDCFDAWDKIQAEEKNKKELDK